MGAECNPDWRPDVLIVESTFGVQQHDTQKERERQFIEAIDRITKRGGKCLIPVFSLGRAQELLLILEEYWQTHPEMQKIPIYHASRLAAMSLNLFHGFINAMNPKIRKQADISNPWELHHIFNLASAEDFDETGPAVVLASPGMLQNGVSRKLFEQWCIDPRNGVIIAGYTVEGTLAKEILREPKEITTLQGRRIPLNCEVKYISFTAHSDFPGTYSFIKQLLPRHTILVHGEQGEMKRLHDELGRKFATTLDMDFCMPQNGQRTTFYFTEGKVFCIYKLNKTNKIIF
jgi:cleavage and polyadenylation specificity factor subunit 3